MVKIPELTELSIEHSSDAVIKLVSRKDGDASYFARTNRNIGWITREEQEFLSQSVVGVAGCGGMGGLVAATLLRLGVGEIRIADCEVFDPSNINRQFAAKRTTIGKSKALETAREMREITDDTTIIVYPQGITEETVEQFTAGCNIVCDLVEFWAMGARILLHQIARRENVTVLNCNTVGHRTNLFRFTAESMTIEDALGFGYEAAKTLQERVQQDTATREEVRATMDALLRVLVPEIPEYFPADEPGTVEATRERLLEERRASIVATNPVMAAGFLANHVLFHLLEHSGTRRQFVHAPLMPGYLSFDAAMMQAVVCDKQWW